MSQEHEYLDFEVQIRSIHNQYMVSVRSPAGEVEESSPWVYSGLQMENQLLTLEKVLLRSATPRRLALSTEKQTVQKFGQTLFNFLLPGDVRSLYRSCINTARVQNRGVRLKLRILPPELASLPWEYLYDEQNGEYVCLSASTPIVRYLDLAQPPSPLSVTPPLRILGMVVSPYGLDQIDVDKEKQIIERALGTLQNNGRLELHWLEGETWRDLSRSLRQGTWHIFHFIGHGGFDVQRDEGYLVLADSQGQPASLSASELARLLGDHNPLRLAFLNACEGAKGGTLDIFSSTASILMRRHLPAVVAMQYAITDWAAMEFAGTFYEVLADGFPVDRAVADARKAVSLERGDTIEWGVPVLHMRAPDGRVFAMEQKRFIPGACDIEKTVPRSSALQEKLSESSEETIKEPTEEEPAEPVTQRTPGFQEDRAQEEAPNVLVERSSMLVSEESPGIPKSSLQKTWSTSKFIYGVGVMLSLIVLYFVGTSVSNYLRTQQYQREADATQKAEATRAAIVSTRTAILALSSTPTPKSTFEQPLTESTAAVAALKTPIPEILDAHRLPPVASIINVKFCLESAFETLGASEGACKFNIPEFSSPISHIRMSWKYQSVSQGVTLDRKWYWNDRLIRESSDTTIAGDDDWTYLDTSFGNVFPDEYVFRPGEYRVEMYLEDTMVQVGYFSVR